MDAEAVPYLMKVASIKHRERLRTCASVSLGHDRHKHRWRCAGPVGTERRRQSLALRRRPSSNNLLSDAVNDSSQRTRNINVCSDSYPKAAWRPPHLLCALARHELRAASPIGLRSGIP
jgi:hypothetical protein